MANDIGDHNRLAIADRGNIVEVVTADLLAG